MTTYQEFCRLRDLYSPGANAPKHTEADAFFMAACQLAVPANWKLVPLEPTPEIIAAAAIAVWPTATHADIALARLAAPIVLMQMDMAPGTTVDAVAGMLATMAPAYRAMLAAAPAQVQEPAIWHVASESAQGDAKELTDERIYDIAASCELGIGHNDHETFQRFEFARAILDAIEIATSNLAKS